MARGDAMNFNPATKWISWSGNTGTLSYYDKETQENVVVDFPFTFLLLDEFTTVKGFNEKAKKGIYSNEVRDTTKQILSVKCDGETIAKGLYKEIKEKVVEAGGGYAKSCYIAYKGEDGKLAIGNITFSGSSFGGGTHQPADKNMKDIEIGAWLSFSKAHAANLYTKAVVIEGKDDRICTQGVVKFHVPKFKLIEVTKETDAEAIALTQVLKAYMDEYFKKVESVHEEEKIAQAVNEAHAKAFGGTPTELTETEKAFLTKPNLEDIGPLPTDGQVDDDGDLPF